ncbi:hypothetical protein MtrunA17_Chr4g0072661 [Medicago truncatula]|uniref:Uncharacterized protein n=1 Tax=Medicago truncatula TaxID=3880 RepID=A0A396IGN6_MEDTR|nr:hypothetical protein MtrunA17_Chr4g0072661 [Medicago truncatula]
MLSFDSYFLTNSILYNYPQLRSQFDLPIFFLSNTCFKLQITHAHFFTIYIVTTLQPS